MTVPYKRVFRAACLLLFEMFIVKKAVSRNVVDWLLELWITIQHCHYLLFFKCYLFLCFCVIRCWLVTILISRASVLSRSWRLWNGNWAGWGKYVVWKISALVIWGIRWFSGVKFPRPPYRPGQNTVVEFSYWFFKLFFKIVSLCCTLNIKFDVMLEV